MVCGPLPADGGEGEPCESRGPNDEIALARRLQGSVVPSLISLSTDLDPAWLEPTWIVSDADVLRGDGLPQVNDRSVFD
ncbi:MAG: hypothetical protein B7Z55_11410, partial [Planctomycetales bacterium 12-60-4]